MSRWYLKELKFMVSQSASRTQRGRGCYRRLSAFWPTSRWNWIEPSQHLSWTGEAQAPTPEGLWDLPEGREGPARISGRPSATSSLGILFQNLPRASHRYISVILVAPYREAIMGIMSPLHSWVSWGSERLNCRVRREDEDGAQCSVVQPSIRPRATQGRWFLGNWLRNIWDYNSLPVEFPSLSAGSDSIQLSLRD